VDPRFIPSGADLDALAKIQEDTVRNLARRYTAQGYEISPEQVDLLIRTIQGEAGNEPAAGQHAVGNTMLNRMADGEDFDRLAGAYDANGLRYAKTEGKSGVPANAGFRNTRPGSMDYNEGIEALMRPQSRFSKFTNLMPDSVKTAKQYYNPDLASPSWGGDSFVKLGNHAFGNEFQKTSEAVLQNRQQSPIFDGAGNVSIDPSQYAENNTLNPFDYEPEFQTPENPDAQSPGWANAYLPQDVNPITAGLTGKPGEIPGSWGDIFNKFDVFSKEPKVASLAPADAPKGPSSYIATGGVYRPKRQRYRPRRARFADIMEGVSGPYG